VLPPRAERAAAEAAGETLYAGKADAVHFGRLPIEHGHATVDEDLADLLGLAPFVVMIAEDRDDRNLHRGGQLADQHPRLIGEAVISEVAAERQHICRVADLAKQRLKRTLRVLRDVKIAHCGNAQMGSGRPLSHSAAAYSNGVPDISSADMAMLHQIWIKRAHRGKMDQGGKRQVTLIDRERWHELTDRGDGNLETNARRANLVIDSVDLFDSSGKTLRIGPARLLIHGETRPCERMDEALPGLQEAMRERWGGGAFAEVIEGGEIAVGDPVEWDF
jgi:hypothetical protein